MKANAQKPGKKAKAAPEAEAKLSSAGNAQMQKSAGLSGRDRNALFAVLAVAALGAAAYVIFFSQPADNPADGSEFYARLTQADKVGFLYDVRGAQGDQVSAIYQCGVDMIGKGRFVGKEIENIGCEDGGCIGSITGMDGTSKVSYDEARRKLSSKPYILIKAGEPSYRFFERHMEISIGTGTPGNVSCDISASES